VEITAQDNLGGIITVNDVKGNIINDEISVVIKDSLHQH
jgi:hypothetical protein